MRGVVQGVDEPAILTNGGAKAAAQVLGEEEGLEVVVDDGLVDAGQLIEALCEEQQSVASQAGGEPRYGARGTVQGAGKLAMGRACEKTCGDRSIELVALAVVREGESLLGEGAVAAQAAEARDHARVAPADEDAMATEPEARRGLLAGRPGTVGWAEGVQRDALDRLVGPVHLDAD